MRPPLELIYELVHFIEHASLAFIGNLNAALARVYLSDELLVSVYGEFHDDENKENEGTFTPPFPFRDYWIIPVPLAYMYATPPSPASMMSPIHRMLSVMAVMTFPIAIPAVEFSPTMVWN